MIERLYRQVNGSLEGLDEQIRSIGAAPAPTEAAAAAEPTPSSEPSPADAGVKATSTPVADASPEPTTATETVPQPTPTPEAAATPSADTAVPVNDPSLTPEATPTPSASPSRRSSFDPRPDAEAPAPKPPTKPAISVVMITGQVLDSDNNPVANVVVVLISPQGTVLASTTNEEGIYSFKIAPSTHNYRLIPSKDGFAFEPVDKVLEGATEDVKGLNFIAAPKSP
jgi:hypothetical protein